MKIKNKYYKQTENLLYNYKMFQISIENMRNEIEELKKEDGLGAINYDTEPISPTFKFSSTTEDVAISISEKIDYLEHSIRRMESKIQAIDKAIEGLNEEEKCIISNRYIDGQQWYIVAYKVGYSERHSKRIRTDAIIKIAIGLNGDRIIEQ